MKYVKIKYGKVKIIIRRSNYNFSHFVIKKNGYLIIIYGTSCTDKSRILHNAIKLL